MSDSRFPYTYACDYIRLLVGYESGSMVLSRAQASKIYNGIAKVIGLTTEELAIKLANHYKDNDDEICKDATQAFLGSVNEKLH